VSRQRKSSVREGQDYLGKFLILRGRGGGAAQSTIVCRKRICLEGDRKEENHTGYWDDRRNLKGGSLIAVSLREEGMSGKGRGELLFNRQGMVEGNAIEETYQPHENRRLGGK